MSEPYMSKEERIGRIKAVLPTLRALVAAQGTATPGPLNYTLGEFTGDWTGLLGDGSDKTWTPCGQVEGREEQSQFIMSIYGAIDACEAVLKRLTKK